MEEMIKDYLKEVELLEYPIFDIEKDGHIVKYSYENGDGEWIDEYVSVWDVMEFIYLKRKEDGIK